MGHFKAAGGQVGAGFEDIVHDTGNAIKKTGQFIGKTPERTVNGLRKTGQTIRNAPKHAAHGVGTVVRKAGNGVEGLGTSIERRTSHP